MFRPIEEDRSIDSRKTFRKVKIDRGLGSFRCHNTIQRKAPCRLSIFQYRGTPMEERRFFEIDDCKTIEMAFARSIRKGGVRIIATRNRSILRIGSISEE